MQQIFETNDKFDFNNLTLGKPTTISGGFFFIRYSVNDSPLYIQPPKCFIKQVQTKSKKMYCDIIFNQENEKFIQWIENLESSSQNIIYQNREKWFETPLELHDIESSFTSPMKSFKSGKSYIVRTMVPTGSIKIYDEDENDIPIESIHENTSVMVILEIQGIRCSSSSFQIDIQLKQMMVLKDLFNKCIFKIKNTETLGKTKPEETSIESPQPQPTPLEDKPLNEPNDIIPPNPEDELCEVDIELNKMTNDESVVVIKDRKEMYYKLYDDARKKAKIARDLALSAYLEAKHIKNTYMLDDNSSSSDEE
jgi:hypothetical protein